MRSPGNLANNGGSAGYLATLLYYRLRRVVLWLIMFQVKPANLNEDNTASEKVILRNGGVLEDTRFDPEERVTVKRYWIAL